MIASNVSPCTIPATGVFAPEERRSWSPDPLVKWTEGPGGQHIELGISEMNLFMLLGQLGLSHEHHGQHLLPVGTVYDPFVLRGLDALIYGLYNGSRFVVAGTPSGVTLAPEGGAHHEPAPPRGRDDRHALPHQEKKEKKKNKNKGEEGKK